MRCLLEFDLSMIPSNAVITDARLSLFNDPTSAESGGQSLSLSGSNESVLQRITSSWNESTVTWNNQPTTTNLNEVVLAQSTSAHEDYLNIDVLNILNDMLQNPSSSFGFMIKLQTEQYFRSMIFASSDNANCNLHPKLDIAYTLPTAINELSIASPFTISPNPSSGDFLISWKSQNVHLSNWEVTNSIGEIIRHQAYETGISNSMKIDLSNQAKGVYFLTLTGKNSKSVKKLVIE